MRLSATISLRRCNCVVSRTDNRTTKHFRGNQRRNLRHTIRLHALAWVLVIIAFPARAAGDVLWNYVIKCWCNNLIPYGTTLPLRDSKRKRKNFVTAPRKLICECQGCGGTSGLHLQRACKDKSQHAPRKLSITKLKTVWS
jgi:hypothetical protein